MSKNKGTTNPNNVSIKQVSTSSSGTHIRNGSGSKSNTNLDVIFKK